MVCVSRNASIKICLSGIFSFPFNFFPQRDLAGARGISSILPSEGGNAAASGADYQRNMLQCPAGIMAAMPGLATPMKGQGGGVVPTSVPIHQAETGFMALQHIHTVTLKYPRVITHTSTHTHIISHNNICRQPKLPTDPHVTTHILVYAHIQLHTYSHSPPNTYAITLLHTHI